MHPATSCGAPIWGWRTTITSGSYAPSVSAVSLSDSPLSTAEPADLTDMTSADRRFAASSKDDDVRVDDSKKRLTTVRPRSVGSFFISRSSERAKLRAVPSRRSMSSRERSATDSRCRRSAEAGGSRSSRMTRMSPIVGLLFWAGDEQDAVDLVDLDELDLDPLAARGRQVLADVVGTDRKLTVAAVGEAGELHASWAAVVEQRVDRGADRPARVEDVVHEHARHPLEREVEPGGADDRLRLLRRLAAAHLNVIAVEGDVDRAGGDFLAAELVDQPAEALRDRDAARVDADQRHPVEVRVRLDDLVRDAGERPGDRRLVQQDFRARLGRQRQPLSFPASRDRVKGRGASGRLQGPADGSHGEHLLPRLDLGRKLARSPGEALGELFVLDQLERRDELPADPLEDPVAAQARLERHARELRVEAAGDELLREVVLRRKPGAIDVREGRKVRVEVVVVEVTAVEGPDT